MTDIKKQRRKPRRLSRREFVKGTIGAGLTAAASGCVSSGLRKIASVDVADDYDYIVVGSGAGGGPVACNLARAGFRVLLLEAGDSSASNKNNYTVPAFHPFAVEDPQMRWDFFVNHYANPEQQKLDTKYVEGKGILYPRAGTLGGCTAHNAMVTLYPDNKDWDDISELFGGDPGWKSDRMRSYYQRLERVVSGSALTQRRGTNGWLGVEQNPLAVRLRDIQFNKWDWKNLEPQNWGNKLWEWKLHTIAMAAAGATSSSQIEFLSQLKDPNDWSYVCNKKDGAFNIPKATWGGKRNGTRELILETLEKYPNNLTLSANSLASRVIFDGPENRAVAIEFYQGRSLYAADPNAGAGSSGVKRTVRAKREIILAGGAFNSPQLLMLSGVGDRDQLARFGIQQRVNRPGVGRNLQDRYEIGVVSKLKSEFEVLKNCNAGQPNDPCLDDFNRDPQSAMYSSNGPIVAMIKKSDPKRDTPDLCVFALPGKFRGYYPGWSKDCFEKGYLTWAVLKGHTRNTTGTVTLKSANPFDTPNINFNYFDDTTDPAGEDLAALVKGVKMARAVNDKNMMSDLMAGEELPQVRGENLETFVKNNSWGHHASCTNKMGPASDPMAVVDNKFRVHGTQGLRVVDASVFPRVPGLFIVVPIYMIAEKASDDIIADARRG